VIPHCRYLGDFSAALVHNVLCGMRSLLGRFIHLASPVDCQSDALRYPSRVQQRLLYLRVAAWASFTCSEPTKALAPNLVWGRGWFGVVHDQRVGRGTVGTKFNVINNKIIWGFRTLDFGLHFLLCSCTPRAALGCWSRSDGAPGSALASKQANVNTKAALRSWCYPVLTIGRLRA
jgi:hypothetical protein